MTHTQPHPLIDSLRQAAAAQGFTLFGVAPAVDARGHADLVRWIDAGYAGQMDYFAKRREAYRHPAAVLPGVRSIIALAYPYDRGLFRPLPPGRGKIARYVWQRSDYHDTIHARLKQLCQVIVTAAPSAAARGVVDTAPLLEREVAQLAGLGWRGKNTLLLNKQQGSYFFLACVLTDLELPASAAHDAGHCGSCNACLAACPTEAFVSPGVLDASRCISYLTIEHRGPIPLDLRGGMGEWLFGCDVCQEVCPWNRKPSRAADAGPADPLDGLDLSELLVIDDDEFHRRFRRTPLWRARRRGIVRNAAIVLGNQRCVQAVPALIKGLQDAEPLVRGASAWALGQVRSPAAVPALRAALDRELDPHAGEEIRAALRELITA